MKRFLPILILIIIPLSLLIAKPAEAYVAQPGDSLWSLAENRVTTGNVMVINAVKNLEILMNNLDGTNYYLEIGQDYKLLTSEQIQKITNDINNPQSAAYLIANPTPNPVWQELRLVANNIPNLQGQTTTTPVPQVDTKLNPTPPPYNPVVQGAHTSLIPLADSPFPY